MRVYETGTLEFPSSVISVRDCWILFDVPMRCSGATTATSTSTTASATTTAASLIPPSFDSLLHLIKKHTSSQYSAPKNPVLVVITGYRCFDPLVFRYVLDFFGTSLSIISTTAVAQVLLDPIMSDTWYSESVETWIRLSGSDKPLCRPPSAMDAMGATDAADASRPAGGDTACGGRGAAFRPPSLSNGKYVKLSYGEAWTSSTNAISCTPYPARAGGPGAAHWVVSVQNVRKEAEIEAELGNLALPPGFEDETKPVDKFLIPGCGFGYGFNPEVRSIESPMRPQPLRFVYSSFFSSHDFTEFDVDFAICAIPCASASSNNSALVALKQQESSLSLDPLADATSILLRHSGAHSLVFAQHQKDLTGVVIDCSCLITDFLALCETFSTHYVPTHAKRRTAVPDERSVLPLVVVGELGERVIQYASILSDFCDPVRRERVCGAKPLPPFIIPNSVRAFCSLEEYAACAVGSSASCSGVSPPLLSPHIIFCESNDAMLLERAGYPRIKVDTAKVLHLRSLSSIERRFGVPRTPSFAKFVRPTHTSTVSGNEIVEPAAPVILTLVVPHHVLKHVRSSRLGDGSWTVACERATVSDRQYSNRFPLLNSAVLLSDDAIPVAVDETGKLTLKWERYRTAAGKWNREMRHALRYSRKLQCSLSVRHAYVSAVPQSKYELQAEEERPGALVGQPVLVPILQPQCAGTPNNDADFLSWSSGEDEDGQAEVEGKGRGVLPGKSSGEYSLLHKLPRSIVGSLLQLSWRSAPSVAEVFANAFQSTDSSFADAGHQDPSLVGSTVSSCETKELPRRGVSLEELKNMLFNAGVSDVYGPFFPSHEDDTTMATETDVEFPPLYHHHASPSQSSSSTVPLAKVARKSLRPFSQQRHAGPHILVRGMHVRVQAGRIILPNCSPEDREWWSSILSSL
eukprot:ANDGO_02841.mRNA.1 hypothetical protein